MRAAQSKLKRAQSPVLIVETQVVEMKILGEGYDIHIKKNSRLSTLKHSSVSNANQRLMRAILVTFLLFNLFY